MTTRMVIADVPLPHLVAVRAALADAGMLYRRLVALHDTTGAGERMLIRLPARHPCPRRLDRRRYLTA